MDFLRNFLYLVWFLVTLVPMTEGKTSSNNNNDNEKWYHIFGKADTSDWKIIFAYIAFSLGAILLLIGFCYLVYVACSRKSSKKTDYKSAKSKSSKNGSNKKQAKYLDNSIGGKSAARHEKDNDSLQVDVSTFYQPEDKHNSKSSMNAKKAEEGGLNATTAVPVGAAAAAGLGAVATAVLVNERNKDDSDDDERHHDEGIGPSIDETEHNSSGHSYEHNDTLKDASSLPDSAHDEEDRYAFGGVAAASHQRRSPSPETDARRSRISDSSDSIDRQRETRDDDSLVRKTTPLPQRSETDISHVDTEHSGHTERDNMAYEHESTSRRSSRSQQEYAGGYGEEFRQSKMSENSGEGIEMTRVSVAEVHHNYNAVDDAQSERDTREPEGDEGQQSSLRRWPSQTSLERESFYRQSRQSDRRGSDVGSINPAWRGDDETMGVGYAEVQGYRQDDTKDSASEHEDYDDNQLDDDRSARDYAGAGMDDDRSARDYAGAGMDDDRSARDYTGAGLDDDRSAHDSIYRDSLADYERPEGFGANRMTTDYEDVPSQRSSVAASSSRYQAQENRSPSPYPARVPTPPAAPELRKIPSPQQLRTPTPQSPLGGPAPAGVSSGLAGMGTLIAARAAKARENDNNDYSTLETNINREQDPSELWLKQTTKVNRISSMNIQSKLGLFEELKAKSGDSWETRRTTIRDSGGPVEYGKVDSRGPSRLQDDEHATITADTPFNVNGENAPGGTLVRKHIAQLESQQDDQTDAPVGLRRGGAFKKRPDDDNTWGDEGNKPLETMVSAPTAESSLVQTHSRHSSKASSSWVPHDNEISSARPSAHYENTVIQSNSTMGDNRGNRDSATLDPDVGDWPDEADYVRSQSDLGSNLTNSRIGSHAYGEDDVDSVRYEPRSSLKRTSGISDQILEPYPPPASIRKSPPPSYHSADDAISSHQMTNGYGEAEPSIQEEEHNDNAFSALDDAVEGFTSNDDSQSHMTQSRASTSFAQQGAPSETANGYLDESDSELNVDIHDDDNDLANGIDRDSEDSGSGRRSSDYRPSTPKPGVIKRPPSIDMNDIVIGDDDPAFNQTMIF